MKTLTFGKKQYVITIVIIGIMLLVSIHAYWPESRQEYLGYVTKISQNPDPDSEYACRLSLYKNAEINRNLIYFDQDYAELCKEVRINAKIYRHLVHDDPIIGKSKWVYTIGK